MTKYSRVDNIFTVSELYSNMAVLYFPGNIIYRDCVGFRKLMRLDNESLNTIIPYR